ncbi:hypothetical protein FAES_1654 [Fibrella aestuarina BUZ 2]|uniref:DUF3592 domain-containing protein n=1 Tax=Fibrella aestuarina BUZ 2 TaxID=1166018 RepID=I0K6B1_9BACT|nr:DUF3592 domain-containing protein [Fibrella aestuarina]CCG99664.1 hypothetical protein FAES_1654 [Fibrella aestuarina BUZ 2]
MATGDKLWLLFLGVFALIGIVCTGIAYSLWSKTRYMKTHGIETRGVVIAHHKKRQITPSTAQAVVVQYTDQHNQSQIYYSTTYTTPPMFQIGEVIKLWYMSDRPNELLMEGKDEWLLPLILGGFGLVFSLIGVPGLIRSLLGTLAH